MSLINDALKRAKEAQRHHPPEAAACLQFRPIDPAPSASKRTGWVLPAVLIFVLLGAGYWYGKWNQTKPAAAPFKPIASALEPNPVPAPALLSILPPQPRPAPVETNAVAKPGELPATNPVGIAPPPPTPAPPKLQAILFDAAHPSAIINGKTVFVNGKVGEYQVSAITATRVTLLTETQTIVLKFDE